MIRSASAFNSRHSGFDVLGTEDGAHEGHAVCAGAFQLEVLSLWMAADGDDRHINSVAIFFSSPSGRTSTSVLVWVEKAAPTPR